MLKPFVHGFIPKQPLHSTFCESTYLKRRNHVQSSTSRIMFWNEKQNKPKSCLSKWCNASTDKPATTFKENEIVFYPVHILHQNFTRTFRRFPIDHGHKLVVLFSEFMIPDEPYERDEKIQNLLKVERSVVLLYGTLPVSMEQNMKNTKLPVPHDPMLKRVQLLCDSVCSMLIVDFCEKKWKRHPALIWFRCDIRERKDMSCMKHGAATLPCIRNFTSMHDISDFGAGPTQPAHIIRKGFSLVSI